MATIIPPDFLQLAKDLSTQTGKTELAMLAVIADTIKRNLEASTNPQIRFHLGLDLAKVEAAIDAWIDGRRI